MLSDKFSLLKKAKNWTNNLSIWSHRSSVKNSKYESSIYTADLISSDKMQTFKATKCQNAKANIASHSFSVDFDQIPILIECSQQSKNALADLFW